MKRLTVIATIALLASTASAHIFPDHAEPAVGSTVKASPASVKIWFTAPIDVPHSSLQVFNAAGKQVDSADVHADPKDDLLIAVSLPPLPVGTYTVTWAATSVHDGHHTKGDFKFTVAS